MINDGINLNLYKVFYEVAKYGSLTRAADLTYTTQSSISKSIKKLESELNCQLFYRKPNGVELTDKGRELLYYVEKSYGNLLIAERILLENENLDRGQLTIGLPSNLYSLLLPNIKEFHQQYPHIELSILTGNTSSLLKDLDTHKIDLFFDTLPIINYQGELTIKKLYSLENCFISNKKLKLTSLHELENESVILPIKNTNNRNLLDECLYHNNIKLNNIINIHTSDLIVSSVKEDLGIGYILKEYIKNETGINVLNIKEELPKTEVAIVYNKKFLTNAPKTFINIFFNN